MADRGERRPSATCWLNSANTRQSTEKLINLGALAGLVELHQLAGQTLLLGLTDGYQFAVQGQEIFQTAAQILFVTAVDLSLIHI